jgi:putative restriction endonuclease
LALSSLHHRLFDRGLIGLTADRTVTVSSHFIGRSSAADSLVLSLVEQPMLEPQAGQPRPHVDHLAWHGREVFRAPARAAARKSPRGQTTRPSP